MFQPYIEIREFDKKVRIIERGEVERYLNIIAWGLARKYLPVRNKEITVQLASEGHIIHCDLSFHYRTPSSAVIEDHRADRIFFHLLRKPAGII